MNQLEAGDITARSIIASAPAGRTQAVVGRMKGYSKWPASVSLPDSHTDSVSSTGLRHPEETEDEEPVVHPSSSEW